MNPNNMNHYPNPRNEDAVNSRSSPASPLVTPITPQLTTANSSNNSSPTDVVPTPSPVPAGTGIVDSLALEALSIDETTRSFPSTHNSAASEPPILPEVDAVSRISSSDSAESPSFLVIDFLRSYLEFLQCYIDATAVLFPNEESSAEGEELISHLVRITLRSAANTDENESPTFIEQAQDMRVRAMERINWAQRVLQLPEEPDFLLEYVRDVIPNDIANLRIVVEIVLETIARVVASLHSNNVSEYEPEAGEIVDSEVDSIVDSEVDSIVDSEVGHHLIDSFGNQFVRNVETGQWVEIGRA